ncbi:MAG: outer membrane beta-barrel protein, partial [Flavobacteriaceae bacterium]|nr:outer membrane beta-barrel protein [Flavobacteriaceae bacterium]
MSRILLIASFLLVILPFYTAVAQEEDLSVRDVDSLYREDQFYLGVTYNLALQTPSGMDLRGLSAGIHFGFLRDMPINEDRTLAIAVGAGLSFDFYGNNLFIGEKESGESIFTILDEDEVNYDRNRFTTAQIQLPIEFRWRNSTPTRYNFWRIYGGVRGGYVYWYRASFRQPGNDVSQTDIPEYERLRLGATLS